MKSLILKVYQETKKSRSSSASLAPEQLYHIDTLKYEEYFKKASGEINITKIGGNVNYSYNIVSIPGKNGSEMSLGIEYNSKESRFAWYGADFTDWKDYYMDPHLSYAVDEGIAAGWEFSMIRRQFETYYIKLRDGRIIDRNKTYYNDFSINTSSTSGMIINYIDGGFERLNRRGYIEYSQDKYGNGITYTYEKFTNYSGNQSERLKSVSDNQGRKILINYYNTYVEIIRPDNSKVNINIASKNVDHIGMNYGFDDTLTAKVVTNIHDVTSNKSIAKFKYKDFCFSPYFGHDTADIMIRDFDVCMAMTEMETSFGESHKIDYSVVDDGEDMPIIMSSMKKYWYLCIENDYIGLDTVNPSATYYYGIEVGKGALSVGYEENANGQIIRDNINTYTGTREQSVYQKQDSYNNMLKQQTVIKYSQNDTSRPKNVTKTIYNDNNDSITDKIEYTYDSYGNCLNSAETTEGNLYEEHTYSYYGNAKKYAMKEHTIKKGSSVLLKTIYDANSYGDVISEQIQDENGDLKSNIQYEYSDNNLVKRTEYDENGETLLKQELYIYTGAYMTRAYTVDSTGNVIASKNFTYDLLTGRITKTSDVTQTETIQYDTLGRIIKELHADGTYKTINYSDIDTVIAIYDENNYKSHYWYNGQGKIKKVTEQTASEDAYKLQTRTYNELGKPISVTDALNNTTSITYDAFGRQTSVKYPGNTATTKAKYYDVFLEGNEKYSVYLTISETGRIACEYYDIYGRLVKTALIKNYLSFNEASFNNIYQMPSNAQLVITSRYVYDDWGRVIEQYDGENRPTYYTYDAMGNVINMKQGNPDTTDPLIDISYEYDTAGNLVKMTQGEHITTYEYDLAGRLVKTTDPMGYTETYTYDTAGNVKTATDKNGTVTTNTYNNRGLLKRTEKNGEYIEYKYDGVGNILTSKDKNGTISYTYNKDGTLASKTYPDGKKITYNSYNGNKALTLMTDYLGNITYYSYNARGAVSMIDVEYDDTGRIDTVTYAYNQDGSLQKVAYPPSSYMTTTYTYDYAGRVSNLTNKLTSSSTYSTHVYIYDNSGNVTQKVDNIEGTSTTTRYIYDNLNRLIKEDIGNEWNTYRYDIYNNLIGECGFGGDVIYSYDANNRLTDIYDQLTYHETASGLVREDWTIDFTYDKAGKLLSSNTHSKFSDDYQGSIKTYTYDTWGRLTKFSDSLGETASYSYYSDGLRASKTIGSDTTKYYYNGDNIINETLNGNSYATNVIGVDGYVSRRQNGRTGYLFKNAHGDVISAYSSTTNKIADYTYDAWGEHLTTGTQAWGASNPIRYNGQYYDTESGMTYLRARYYDSSMRRFISEDQHWNVDNMIYGDEQQAVEYRIVDNIKIYYDKYGNEIERKEYDPAWFTSIEQNNLDGTVSIQRIPDINSILQGNNLYAYGINNPVKNIDPSGKGVMISWAGTTWWLAGVDGPLPIGDIIYIGGIGVCVVVDVIGGVMYLSKQSKSSDKEKANDIPSWARGNKPYPGESGKDFAKRLCDERYGKGNYRTGAGSEYNKIKKYGDRGGN